jgi:hypothetical protein
MDDEDDVQPGHVDVADRAAVEVVGVEREALSAVGVFPDPARTEHAAGTGLEERSLEDVARFRFGRLRLSDGHGAPPWTAGSSDPWIDARPRRFALHP